MRIDAQNFRAPQFSMREPREYPQCTVRVLRFIAASVTLTLPGRAAFQSELASQPSQSFGFKHLTPSPGSAAWQ